jgi:hypothetical protein
MFILKYPLIKTDRNPNFWSVSKLFISYNYFLLLENKKKYPFSTFEDYITNYIIPDKDLERTFNVTCIRRIMSVRRATLIDEALGSQLYAINTVTHRSGLFRLCSRSKGSMYQGIIRNCMTW